MVYSFAIVKVSYVPQCFQGRRCHSNGWIEVSTGPGTAGLSLPIFWRFLRRVLAVLLCCRRLNLPGVFHLSAEPGPLAVVAGVGAGMGSERCFAYRHGTWPCLGCARRNWLERAGRVGCVAQLRLSPTYGRLRFGVDVRAAGAVGHQYPALPGNAHAPGGLSGNTQGQPPGGESWQMKVQRCCNEACA